MISTLKLGTMNGKQTRGSFKSRALTTGSLVIVVLIVISIALLAGYGSYKYVPQVHSVVHNIVHPTTTAIETIPSTSTRIVPTTTITITQPEIVSTEGGTTEFFVATTTASTSRSTGSTASTSVTSSGSSQTSVNVSASSTQSTPFVLRGAPSVYLVNGQAFLNVTYSNTLNESLSVYEHVILTSTGTMKQIGSPLFNIIANGTMSLSLQLGLNLSPGDYLVTFYVVNNSTGQQVSGSESIHFRV
ncbi:MAG: hypothetical protein ACREBS_04090 [Nitrososphaerales archaeon]